MQGQLVDFTPEKNPLHEWRQPKAPSYGIFAGFSLVHLENESKDYFGNSAELGLFFHLGFWKKCGVNFTLSAHKNQWMEPINYYAFKGKIKDNSNNSIIRYWEGAEQLTNKSLSLASSVIFSYTPFTKVPIGLTVGVKGYLTLINAIQSKLENIYEIEAKEIGFKQWQIISKEEAVGIKNIEVRQSKYNYNPFMIGLTFPIKRFKLDGGIALNRFTYEWDPRTHFFGIINFSLSYLLNKEL